MYNLENKKILVLDTEYNNMRSQEATKCWCLCATEVSVDSLGNVKEINKVSFAPKDEGPEEYHKSWAKEALEYLEEGDFDFFVAHHLWGAEYPILKNLIGFTIPVKKAIDTLVWSRTIRPSSPFMNKFRSLKEKGLDNRLGGHGIKPWGDRLGLPKIEFDEYSYYSHEMLTYCKRDVDVNVKVFEQVYKEKLILDFSEDALMMENKAHKILTRQQEVGFTLDKKAALKLKKETDVLIEEYTAELHKVFPPIKVPTRKIVPRWKDLKVRDSSGKLVKNPDGSQKTERVMHGTDHKTLRNSIHEEVCDNQGNLTGEYQLYTMEEFNPNSPQQVGKRLISIGWNPKKYTATGQPSTAKDVLGDAIDYLAQSVPEVEVLRKFNIVTHRNQSAKDWLARAEEDGKVHGRVDHIGPWTHRSSHKEPNMGNISKVQLDKDGKPLEGLEGNFGWDSRNCWIAQKGWKVVGCDASGIQLRALAHYINDGKYIHEVCEGDVHVANMQAAGIEKGYQGMSPRDVSKRFIYAWLLGAGDEKIGQIVGVEEEEHPELFALARKEYKWNWFRHEKGKKESPNKYDNLLFWATDKLRSDGRLADKKTTAIILKGYYTKKKFLNNLPALKRFKEIDIEQAAAKDYMIGLDGRHIWVPNAHFAMGAYLQGFEAVVMKTAMVLYQERLQELGIPFNQLAYVHDEFQVETPEEYTEIVGKTIVWAIKEAGLRLKVNCPLDGEYKVGNSWAETH